MANTINTIRRNFILWKTKKTAVQRTPRTRHKTQKTQRVSRKAKALPTRDLLQKAIRPQKTANKL